MWDKTNEKCKDKFKILEAWKAVCTEIIDGYADFDDSKKMISVRKYCIFYFRRVLILFKIFYKYFRNL